MKGSELPSPSPSPEVAAERASRRTFQFRNAAVALLVGLAALGTFVITPRPSRPRLFPLPVVDVVALRAVEIEQKRLALDARSHGLSVATRTIGEEFRRLNRELAVPGGNPQRWLEALGRDVEVFLEQHREKELLELRALQAELFVKAVRARWAGGDSLGDSSELLELAGPFETWAAETFGVVSGRLAVSDDELALLFRVHWGRMAGVHRRPPFGPSLDEFRRYYSSQLQHPRGGIALDPLAVAPLRIESARALGELDPSYPADLAVGLFLLEAGEAEAARPALLRHLEAHPDGSWALIARNAALAAQRGAAFR